MPRLSGWPVPENTVPLPARPLPPSQVLPGSPRVVVAVAFLASPHRQAAAHLLQLRPRRHLLGEQRRLQAVEQPFQPTDQLRLRDPQFGVGRGFLLGERQREPLQLLDELRGQALLQFPDRGLVDLLQPGAAGLVQGRRAHFLEQLLDHRADAHHLGRLFDQVTEVFAALLGLVALLRLPGGAHRFAVLSDDEDVRVAGVLVVVHASILACRRRFRPTRPPGTSATRRRAPRAARLRCLAWRSTSLRFAGCSPHWATGGCTLTPRQACRFQNRWRPRYRPPCGLRYPVQAGSSPRPSGPRRSWKPLVAPSPI